MLTKISVTCSVDLPANDLNQREIDLVQDPAAHYSIIGEDRKSANDAQPAVSTQGDPGRSFLNESDAIASPHAPMAKPTMRP
jgi:hypothetical protein